MRTRWLVTYAGPDMLWGNGWVLCAKLFPYWSLRCPFMVTPAALSIEIRIGHRPHFRVGSDSGDGRHVGAYV